jgi:hypothetical protein
VEDTQLRLVHLVYTDGLGCLAEPVGIEPVESKNFHDPNSGIGVVCPVVH